MSLFIDLVETFELHALTHRTYNAKIYGLLNSFPELEGNNKYRTVLPYKYPKTADDYVSMKLCIIGRVPVYGIYNRRDLQLIAVCVQGTLFAIDDCDLNPYLIPDLKFQRLHLNVKHSSRQVRECLSYTMTSMCYAISTLSLGYTPEKKNEWTEAIVLLMGMTTHAVRLKPVRAVVGWGLYLEGDAKNMPTMFFLRVMNIWGQISEAIREGDYSFFYQYYDKNGALCSSLMLEHFIEFTVALVNDNSDKFLRRNDAWLGGKEIRRRCLEDQKRKKRKKTWIRWWLEIQGASAKYPERPTDIVNAKNYILPGESCLQGTRQELYSNWSGLCSSLKWPLHRGSHRSISTLPALHRASANCLRPMFIPTTFSLWAKRCKVSASMKEPCFDQLGNSEENYIPGGTWQQTSVGECTSILEQSGPSTWQQTSVRGCTSILEQSGPIRKDGIYSASRQMFRVMRTVFRR